MRTAVRTLTTLFVFLSGFVVYAQKDSLSGHVENGGVLKSVVYDFDGLSTGSNDLPDGDYGNNDVEYSVAPNPQGPNDMLGDRVLRLQMNWQSGFGAFGKATSRFYDLNTGTDRLNFYFLNTVATAVHVKVNIAEDDDNNNYFEFHADDRWAYDQQIPASSSWQLFSIPLSSFYDDNSGGNGVFDAGYQGAGGMVFSVAFHFQNQAGNSYEEHYIDMICFSENGMPKGAGLFDLPSKDVTDYCEVGALAYAASADQIPSQIEPVFQNMKKIKYVNWFLYYASSGTTPNVYPGPEVENLIQNGYQPIITWEMMYEQYSRLDPVQPRLDKILNGSFDWYIDAFADKIKTYSGTVILRIFHEFEGDWYPWSLTQNGQDPNTYIAAYRHVVDRFRARGANNVKWMWCLNADTKPWLRYNWVVPCYPGDNYVDIVATDIYNHPNTGVPAWKSFRFTMAESYYTLTKYFSHKPLYIAEVGCRERYASENHGSQTKGEWMCAMDRDLQSFFSKARALVFFSVIKEHDWRLNSTPQAQQAIQSCIWQDPYYGAIVGTEDITSANYALAAFPNPFSGEINVEMKSNSGEDLRFDVRVTDVSGQTVFFSGDVNLIARFSFGSELSSGIYIIEVSNKKYRRQIKVIKTAQ